MFIGPGCYLCVFIIFLYVGSFLFGLVVVTVGGGGNVCVLFLVDFVLVLVRSRLLWNLLYRPVWT